ncbi:N utilization substance protein B [Microbacterium faecale]|uniref:Transcription antitermination protein NusB n=1 Tax=Microbacterium faecale TaxID=1804630 RepID=A0A916YBY5_9MICO|nr:transcription antitermination factor NusB [Microbacterium faecale]GGD38069.1 N utilization substance protein B [Microbacterium faecale]
MSARTKARRRALNILFSADIRGDAISVALDAEAVRAANEPERAASWLYAREIVDGVIDHLDEIDELLTTHSRDWRIERMPAVDRAVLRLSTWELVYNDEIDVAVAIDEAVELVKDLSTDGSGAFVNGVLARIARAS